MKRLFLLSLFFFVGARVNAADPFISTTTTASPIIIVHPAEGAHLPPLSQAFVYGSVPPGFTMTLNNAPLTLHRKGGFLTMVPVQSGNIALHFEAVSPKGEVSTLDRHFSVATGFTVLPSTPIALDKNSVQPNEDLTLGAGDLVHVSFQATPGGQAEFSIEGVAAHIPMVEFGTFPAKNNITFSSTTTRGIYDGTYVIASTDKAFHSAIEVNFKKDRTTLKAKAPGALAIINGGVPHMGLITDDTVAARTGPDGGYDLFLYRGMRVRLTGKIGNEWRVGIASQALGWVKGSALIELPTGAPLAQSAVTNFSIVHQEESTVLRVPLSEALPYRSEETNDPARLTITLYGAVDKTDLIKFDPLDPLLRYVGWRQISADACQIIIEPTFKKWWGYDVHYEGTTLVVEVRKPYESKDLKGMVIAIDPGHGGSDSGAVGPHVTLEKEANLQIAKVVVQALEHAGAKPFLTREVDMDVPLYERPRIAWGRNARLFVSVHCNASGEGENPLWNNGFSTYWYQPQSADLARDVHAAYIKTLNLPDHGLFYADLAVCRMTQMPAILTEQAYIIVPEQEDLLFTPDFQHKIASSIVNGIRAFLARP